MDCSKYFVVLLVTLFMHQTFGFDIALNKNAVPSDSLEIMLNLGTINTKVTLNKPDGSSAGNCLAPIGGVSGGCTTGFTQDFTNGVTTFSIASVSRATDEGTWTSAHGSDTGSITIKVLTIPTLIVSQTVSALTLSSSNTQSLTITATCAYPAVSLDLYFVPTGGGTAVSSSSSTSTCTSTGNAGCADTDAESYDCVIVPKPETSITAGTYYVQFVVNLAGQYEPIGLNSTITDTVLTIEGPTTTTPTTTTTTPTTTTTTPTTTTTTPTTTTTTPTTTTPTTTTPTTTTTITPPNTTSRFTDEELGAVIGGTIGGICLLFILGLGVFYYYRVQNEESVIKDHKRKDRRDRGDRNKPLRGDNQQGPMEKEEVVVYHKGQAYLVDSKYQKDSKMRSHGYNNNGYYHEPHTRETRHHNSMGRTRSNGHFISPQSYTGHRSDRHYGSSQIYKGQRSDPQIYHPSQPYNGGNIYPQYERYPGLGRGDDRHMYY